MMKILLTGDSIIERHEGKTVPRLNYELKKLLPLEIINTAVSGINTGAFYAQINDLVLKQNQCDILAILLGTNDLALHKQVPRRQFQRNLELIASTIICKYWPPKVILISPPAVDELKQTVRNNQLVAQYSEIVAQVAQEYNFHYLNLYSAMERTNNLSKLCQGLKNDGLHFGKEGYKLLAKLLVQQLLKI